MKPEPQRARSVGDAGAVRHVWAWLLLVGVLALHVIDEALTHFLDFYNPLVLSLRSRISWFPMPTFTLQAWLAGLVVWCSCWVPCLQSSIEAALRLGSRPGC